MDMNLLGASPTSIEREGESQDYTNYYYAHCPNGVTNVRSYSTITYKNVYPNIDLVYRQNASGVKYDLIVNPGGNVSDIHLQYNGADAVTATDDGRVHVTNPLGRIEEAAPYTYQTSALAPTMLDVFDSHNDGAVQTVSASYHISNSIVTFNVGSYDHSQPLVIDPTLQWCTFYGGSGDEFAFKIAVDSEDNVLVTGCTSSTDFPVTVGAAQTTYKGNYDAYAVKFTPKGNRIWATYYGGTNREWGVGIASDKSNDVLITGYTISTDFPITNQVFQTTNHANVSINGSNVFIVKLDSAGACVWATYYGGSYDDQCSSIATDANGNIIIVGTAESRDFPITSGAFQTTNNSTVNPNYGENAFIAKFDGACNLLWATYYGGSKFDYAIDVSTDKNNNIIVVGNAASFDFPVSPGAFQTPAVIGSNNIGNGFLLKFDRNGNRLWATLYTGSQNSAGTVPAAVAVDKNGNIAFTGNTDDRTFPTTSGAFQPSLPSPGAGSAFAVEFDGAGNRLWATYYGGNSVSTGDVGYDIATDMNGNIFMTGINQSGSTFPVTKDAFQSNITATTSFIVEFDPSGVRKYATEFGVATDTTYGIGITTDKGNNVLITGLTNANAPAFPITAGAFQRLNGGGFDAFVAKFCMLNVSVQPAPNDSVCKGDSVTIGGSAIAGGTPPYSYQWSPTKWLNSTAVAVPTASPDSTTTYYETVTDAGGCVAMDTVTVFVRPSPQVTVSGSVTTCKGTRVGLNATVTGGKPPYTYIWRPSYGLNSTSILNPFAKPDSTTMYYLTASDSNGCTGLDSVLVKVNQPPVLNAGDTMSRTICKGSAVTIGGIPVSGKPPYRYNWSPGAGLSATNVALPIASPAATTKYTVIITDINGCQTQGEVTVTVGSSLSPKILVTGSTILCGNDSVMLDAGSGYATYLWSTGATTESITVTKAGMYSVACSDATGCSGTSDTVTITQGHTPSPAIAGPDTVCASSTNVYTINNVLGDFYLWSVVGGTITSGAGTSSINVQWNSFGNEMVNVTEIDGSSHCSGSASIAVFVVNSAVPAVTASGSLSFCAGDSVVLSASGGFTSYLWSDGETKQNIIVKTSGTYTVMVMAAGGCTGTSSPIAVTVGSVLVPVITGAPAFCPGDSTVLDAGSGYDTYLWSTGATTETITVTQPGTYTVSVTKGTCAGTSADYKVTVYPMPVATISASGDTLLSSPAASYQWNLNGTAIQGATAQRYIAVLSGNYTVTVTDANGCVATSIPFMQAAGIANICIDASPSIVAPQGFMTATMHLTDAIVPPTDSLVFDLHYDAQALELDSIGESPCTVSTKNIALGLVHIKLTACVSPLPAEALCTASFTPLVSSQDTVYTQLLVDNIKIYPLADSITGAGCSAQVTVLPLCGLHGVFYIGATTLAQNYPNPFTGTTAIHVTLSQSDAQSARLVVCNVLGEQVADLTDQLNTNGDVTFNAGANKAGVYYYVLETASGRLTRQMFVVK
jgi:hypothetical protein